MNMNKKVICFVGPSGVGKTSYARRLVEKYNLKLPVVVTTRKQRSDDNERYLYVDESIFVEMLNSKSFLEWDMYSGYYYGTLLKSIEDIVSEKYCCGVVLDLTPDGCKKVKEIIPTAIIISLLPDDSAWLFERLIDRNSQSLDEIQTRMNFLKNYLNEMESLVCNKIYASFSPDSWDKTFEAIEKIIFK